MVDKYNIIIDIIVHFTDPVSVNFSILKIQNIRLNSHKENDMISFIILLDF